MSKFNFFKKSLKIPYRILNVGEEQAFLFFEVGGEVFYVSSSLS